MGTFLFLVGFILFVVAIVMLVINAIKKRTLKNPVILMIVGIVLFFVGVFTFSGDKKETNSSDSKTSETTTVSSSEKKDSDAETNKLIANDLQQDLGWALGKLDSDGNPTENGTPNEDFAWAVFVEKVEIVEDGTQLNVYVTPEFTSLNDESKSKIISSAQNMASVYTDNAEKLFTVVYQGNKQIGSSTILDKSEFKFDK